MASLGGLRIWRCCELASKSAATAPIRPLASEPPYAVGAALGKAKRQKKKLRTKMQSGLPSHPLSQVFIGPRAALFKMSFSEFPLRLSGNKPD